MHDAVSVVIPGAKNKDHVNLNTSSSNINEISSLMDEINSVYTKYFLMMFIIVGKKFCVRRKKNF